MRSACTVLGPAAAALALGLFVASPAAASEGAGGLGASLPALSALPFVLLLLAIAVLPLAVGPWWEHNRNKGAVAAALAVPFAAWLVWRHGAAGLAALEHAGLDYISFICLLFSLFVISGGVYVRGSLEGTPLANTAILGIGAILANVIGTTGASTVLIRPLLRANRKRRRQAHIVVFFIFTVSNCAGLLTPLGDPPLFLGFLGGVPFAWTLRLWPQWLLVNGLLLIVFNFVDQRILFAEEKARPEAVVDEVMEHAPIRLDGLPNLLYLAGVVLVILGKGGGWGFGGEEWPFGLQEGLMLALAAGAYATTRREVREANRFTFGPIIEVAVLFAGIFTTMVAPLLLLNAHGQQLGLRLPWHFFWATGSLSSFLDNAPTYLTFAAAACGRLGVDVSQGGAYLKEFLSLGGEAAGLLTAISTGAVFMGANTYIGNGPNFMVKSIAEENGVKMPSFFGYMGYSMTILIPIFAVVTLVFFR